MMKIKFNSCVYNYALNRIINYGEIVDFEDENLAKSLVEANMAIEINDEKESEEIAENLINPEPENETKPEVKPKRNYSKKKKADVNE